MNKKGFAVSVILYSIVFLIITTLFMLLGIMRTRFNVNNELREKIRESINEEVSAGTLFPSSEKCEIKGNTSNYTDNLILTINVSKQGEYVGDDNNGKLYSWDNEAYSTNRTITVNRSGIYTGYFKDNVGGSGSCEIEIISKTQYSSRTCNIIAYGEWYADSTTTSSTCTNITQASAESTNSDTYRICSGSNPYTVKTYKRNPVGCNSWNAWSVWSDTFPSNVSAIKQSRSATTYKIKNA